MNAIEKVTELVPMQQAAIMTPMAMIDRALASGKPAVINVMIESIPSPVMRC